MAGREASLSRAGAGMDRLIAARAPRRWRRRTVHAVARGRQGQEPESWGGHIGTPDADQEKGHGRRRRRATMRRGTKASLPA
ncbi:hypothetical protein Ga0080559_TMP1274 [Salipiger profundus]|uniref:Uncharacterized protein n=1 Tax=Salipiger profundus TaxID=1229727 RepID=A0A1U7D1X1_9RHOB|nr:hypothetical protein Ga0080559_TMP1274 [Salipiger profundus]